MAPRRISLLASFILHNAVSLSCPCSSLLKLPIQTCCVGLQLVAPSALARRRLFVLADLSVVVVCSSLLGQDGRTVDPSWLDSAQFASCSSLRRARSISLFLRVLPRSSLFSSHPSRCRAHETACSRYQVRDARVGHGKTLRVLVFELALAMALGTVSCYFSARVLLFAVATAVKSSESLNSPIISWSVIDFIFVMVLTSAVPIRTCQLTD